MTWIAVYKFQTKDGPRSATFVVDKFEDLDRIKGHAKERLIEIILTKPAKILDLEGRQQTMKLINKARTLTAGDCSFEHGYTMGLVKDLANALEATL